MVVKFTPASRGACGVHQILIQPWKIYVDGALNVQCFGVEVVLESLEGIRVEHSLGLGF